MLECEGESVSEKEDPRSLFITIITRHHRHHLFNQYIDIQVYIYIARHFFCAKQVHHKYSAGQTFLVTNYKCTSFFFQALPFELILLPSLAAFSCIAEAVTIWGRAASATQDLVLSSLAS